jgi:hypothetical protein
MTVNAGREDLDHLISAKHIPNEEPKFLLRARDPAAAGGVRAWASVAKALGVPIAVIEQALTQADRMDAWPHKQLPDAGHLTAPERLQLEFRHSRRAWRANLETGPDVSRDEAILLAERRGWNEAMAHIRAGGSVAA